MESLIQSMLQGDRRAFSRLLSLVEKQDEECFIVLKKIWNQIKPLPSIGITGPQGAGKSTLIDQLIVQYRAQNKKVGVIAVDPSSPFTMGAVLGDRIRMHKHFVDEQVFIRSISNRGQTGGLSFATRALMRLFHAFGIEELMVETVGAGQSETMVSNLVDTTVVVLVPESGDSIQALKAGILEIADVYVVNKCDRPGSDIMVHELQALVAQSMNKHQKQVQVVSTQADVGKGVGELVAAIDQHREHLKNHPTDTKTLEQKRLNEMKELLSVFLLKKVEAHLVGNEQYMRLFQSKDSPNPYELCEEVLKKIKLNF